MARGTLVRCFSCHIGLYGSIARLYRLRNNCRQRTPVCLLPRAFQSKYRCVAGCENVFSTTKTYIRQPIVFGRMVARSRRLALGSQIYRSRLCRPIQDYSKLEFGRSVQFYPFHRGYFHKRKSTLSCSSFIYLGSLCLKQIFIPESSLRPNFQFPCLRSIFRF